MYSGVVAGTHPLLDVTLAFGNVSWRYFENSANLHVKARTAGIMQPVCPTQHGGGVRSRAHCAHKLLPSTSVTHQSFTPRCM